MGWFILTQLFSIRIQLIRIGRMSDHEKDLETLILRYQLDMAERTLQTPLKPTRVEKLILAVLVAKLTQGTRRPANQLRDLIRLFQPETVLRWHRQLVRRKRSPQPQFAISSIDTESCRHPSAMAPLVGES